MRSSVVMRVTSRIYCSHCLIPVLGRLRWLQEFPTECGSGPGSFVLGMFARNSRSTCGCWRKATPGFRQSTAFPAPCSRRVYRRRVRRRFHQSLPGRCRKPSQSPGPGLSRFPVGLQQQPRRFQLNNAHCSTGRLPGRRFYQQDRVFVRSSLIYLID